MSQKDDFQFEYIYNFVDTICKKFGPRYSCSKAEKDANLWIKGELDNFCEETHIDEFQTRPGLYPQGLVKVTGFLVGISFIFMPLIFPFPIFALVFVGLGLLVLYTELFLMKEYIGFLFKKGISSNVFGMIKPTEDTKFRIIFEGHTDSAKEMPIASYEEHSPRIKIGLGLYYIFHTIAFSLWKFFAQILYGDSIVLLEWWVFSITFIDLIYCVPLTIVLPLFVWVVRGFIGKKVVLGANDNLVSSAICACLGKYFHENRPKHVEVWVGSMGSEEVGDKGAKAFVEKYGDLGKLDNAYSVILDSCGAGEMIFLIHKDMHRAEYSSEIIEKIVESRMLLHAEDPNFSNYRKGKLFIGACDACRYIHKGYKAAAIFAADSKTNKPKYWHTEEDIPDNLEKKITTDIYKLCVKFVELIDESYNYESKKLNLDERI
ncbi:MAG: M28 family peptidase [Candidatus Lokiarchaeota archaeon]|nr:M28 family peptidase [Candidatus Lokiarchaeota archaeon]MBD3341684.1 M28 family peptidase [Candidatus Lokiarchaeota archaeon]